MRFLITVTFREVKDHERVRITVVVTGGECCRIIADLGAVSQTLYGFGRIEKELIAINQGDYYSPARKGKLKAVELNDCGELWILKFEFFDLMIKLYAVKPSEVEELLNECRKPAMLDYAIL